jgi:glucose/arabinose dehydrogenase
MGAITGSRRFGRDGRPTGRLAAGLAALALAIGAGGGHGAAADWPAIDLEFVAGGFAAIVQITHAGDGTDRLFVVEQAGTVRIVEDGITRPAPFLDVTDRVLSGGERGLLSIAFPPGYSAKGYFYIDYTRSPDGASVVSRIPLSGDPNVADPAGEEILLVVPQPYANHNGGQLAFGPLDGYLYVGLGDGGSGGDPGNRAQDPGELLGKILRLDVEGGAEPYGVPPDNPFVGATGWLPEIWALGLRNPWRFAFDRATGDLFIADVGQNLYEEINVQSAASPGGENYGWRIMEGAHCYNPTPCDPTGLVLPVFEYTHALGCSVTGGAVYRGAAWPLLDGIYFCGDYCSGRIWGVRPAAGDGWESVVLLDSALNITAFGEDEAGEVYVADYGAGRIHRLVEAGPPCPDAVTVAAPGELAGQNLAGSGNDFTGLNCNPWSMRGDDRLYRIELGELARLVVTVTPQNPAADPDLYLLADCEDPLSCVGYGDAELVFSELAAGVWYLLVDTPARAGTQVPFRLAIGWDAPFLYGDLTGNGLVTTSDADILGGVLAGSRSAASPDEEAADVARDGRVDLRDLIALRLFLNGVADKLPLWDRKN